MRETRMIMGMPIVVEIVDGVDVSNAFKKVFAYFEYVDEKFSTYKPDSEISRVYRREIEFKDYSSDLLQILALAHETNNATYGYFDIQKPDGQLDPSGLVKGWAINNAGKILRELGFNNFYVDAGGDVETAGFNNNGDKWRIGIRNPFSNDPIKPFIKVLGLSDRGVATSGNYIRGDHIYNPKKPNQTIDDVVSLTVVGPNVYEADRFATAAFAMGKSGIDFIESLKGYEGYLVTPDGTATLTTGFADYCLPV